MTSATHATNQQFRILVIDNDPCLLEFFHHILESHGYLVIPCTTLEEAMEITMRCADPVHLMMIHFEGLVKKEYKKIEELKGRKKNESIPIVTLTEFPLTNKKYNNIVNLSKMVMIKGHFEITRFHHVIDSILNDNVISFAK